LRKRKKQIIGTTDFIDLPQLELPSVACKIDTGAYTSTINCSDVYLKSVEKSEFLCFKLFAPKFNITNPKEFHFNNFKQRKVRSSNGLMEIRYSITTPVIIFNRTLNTEFTLSFREKMRFPILLGRRFLRNRFIVDVAQKNRNQSFKNNL
jgi:hypothetical protein